MKTTNQFEIDAETLQTWLKAGEAVEVIDIRPHADYESWHIPGSRNVDAYHAIYAHSPGPLADYEAPADIPVVAVCFVGQTSMVAAQYLRSRGIHAVSLSGGMQAWSQAWNTAEVPLENHMARVIQVRRTGKGCLSYLIGSNGNALVLDPSLDPQVYLDLAAENGWHITKVLDTHIHADHLSRSRLLTEAIEAPYYLPRQDRVAYEYNGIDHGDLIEIGDLQLRAYQTPGHTFESMSFALDGEAIFTGDTLFIDSVGRPDLKANRAETELRTRALHMTLQGLKTLDPETIILPGHTSRPVPFDHAPVAARFRSVLEKVDALGYEQDEFVTWILGRIPPNPPNYETIVQFNEAGRMPEIGLDQLEAGANRCAI